MKPLYPAQNKIKLSPSDDTGAVSNNNNNNNNIRSKRTSEATSTNVISPKAPAGRKPSVGAVRRKSSNGVDTTANTNSSSNNNNSNSDKSAVRRPSLGHASKKMPGKPPSSPPAAAAKKGGKISPRSTKPQPQPTTTTTPPSRTTTGTTNAISSSASLSPPVSSTDGAPRLTLETQAAVRPAVPKDGDHNSNTHSNNSVGGGSAARSEKNACCCEPTAAEFNRGLSVLQRMVMGTDALSQKENGGAYTAYSYHSAEGTGSGTLKTLQKVSLLPVLLYTDGVSGLLVDYNGTQVHGNYRHLAASGDHTSLFWMEWSAIESAASPGGSADLEVPLSTATALLPSSSASHKVIATADYVNHSNSVGKKDALAKLQLSFRKPLLLFITPADGGDGDSSSSSLVHGALHDVCRCYMPSLLQSIEAYTERGIALEGEWVLPSNGWTSLYRPFADSAAAAAAGNVNHDDGDDATSASQANSAGGGLGGLFPELAKDEARERAAATLGELVLSAETWRAMEDAHRRHTKAANTAAAAAHANTNTTSTAAAGGRTKGAVPQSLKLLSGGKTTGGGEGQTGANKNSKSGDKNNNNNNNTNINSSGKNARMIGRRGTTEDKSSEGSENNTGGVHRRRTVEDVKLRFLQTVQQNHEHHRQGNNSDDDDDDNDVNDNTKHYRGNNAPSAGPQQSGDSSYVSVLRCSGPALAAYRAANTGRPAALCESVIVLTKGGRLELERADTTTSSTTSSGDGGAAVEKEGLPMVMVSDVVEGVLRSALGRSMRLRKDDVGLVYAPGVPPPAPDEIIDQARVVMRLVLRSSSSSTAQQ